MAAEPSDATLLQNRVYYKSSEDPLFYTQGMNRLLAGCTDKALTTRRLILIPGKSENYFNSIELAVAQIYTLQQKMLQFLILSPEKILLHNCFTRGDGGFLQMLISIEHGTTFPIITAMKKIDDYGTQHLLGLLQLIDLIECLKATSYTRLIVPIRERYKREAVFTDDETVITIQGKPFVLALWDPIKTRPNNGLTALYSRFLKNLDSFNIEAEINLFKKKLLCINEITPYCMVDDTATILKAFFENKVVATVIHHNHEADASELKRRILEAADEQALTILLEKESLRVEKKGGYTDAIEAALTSIGGRAKSRSLMDKKL